MRFRVLLGVLICAGVLARGAQGQAAGAAAQPAAPVAAPKPLVGSIASHADWPKGNAADTATVDGMVRALYDVISGPAGKPRDWDRFRSLFAPDGRLGIVRPASAAVAAAEGRPARPAREGDMYFITPEMYVERDAPFFAKEGFFERGVANRVEQFGNLTHVWSTYESRHAEGDAKPFARGINSIQMINARGRWWIVSLVWDDEREGLVLPEKYLRQP